MTSFFKRFALLYLFFFIPVLPANSLGCIPEEQFQSLKANVAQNYLSQAPNLVSYNQVLDDNRILFLMSRRGIPGSNTVFAYTFDAKFLDGGAFKEGSLIINSAFRGASDVTGRWATFLDYIEMMHAVRSTEQSLGALPSEGLDGYLPKTIKHTPVVNKYLQAGIKEKLAADGIATVAGEKYINIQPDDPFFKVLTEPMSESEAERLGFTSRGHNGSQTMGLIDLLNLEASSSHLGIDYIQISGAGDYFDMEFYLEHGALDLN